MSLLKFFTLKYLVLISLWSDYLWEQYIRARQYQKILNIDEPPVEIQTSRKTFKRAKLYTLERKKLTFWKDFLSIVTSTIIISYEILPLVWKHVTSTFQVDPVFQNCIWYLTVTTLLSVINLPLTIYEIFVVEKKSMRVKNEFLPLEKLKNFIWSQILLMAISSLLVLLIQKGDTIFLTSWVTLCFMVFIIGVTFPMLCPPRFRQLTLLPPGELRTEIFNLAQDLNFPLKEIYLEENFKKSSQSTYLYGTPKQKKLILCRFLLMQEEGVGYSNEEILALVSLEFGRWYYNHPFKYIVALEINLWLSFAAFFVFFKNPETYKMFGFRTITPILVGVYVVLKYVMAFYSTILSFFFMYISRRFTMKEDKFAVQLGKSEELASALIKQEKCNMRYPVYDWLYSLWHHDKPPLVERIKAIKEDEDLKCD